MSLFNEIQVGRFNRAYQKLTGIKGGAPVKQLGSEIMPGLDIPWSAEFDYLAGWSWFGMTNQITTGGAGVARYRFFNPLANNTLVVIDKLQILNIEVTAQIVNLEGWLGTSSTSLASIISSFVTPLDSRGNQGTGCVISTDNANAAGSFGNTPGVMGIPAGDTRDWCIAPHQKLILTPGQGLQLRNPVAGKGMTITHWWHERFFEDSERS